MQRSDEELYQLMKKGNQDAFAQLYARRAPALRRYALHTSGSPPVAEEVSHEVFLQLMSPSCGYDESKGSLESFLYGIARNLVRVVRRQGPVEEAVDRAFEHDILGDLISSETTAALHRTCASFRSAIGMSSSSANCRNEVMRKRLASSGVRWERCGHGCIAPGHYWRQNSNG